jgi:hypothetical protein
MKHFIELLKQLIILSSVQNGGLVAPGAFQFLRQGCAGNLRPGGAEALTLARKPAR